MRFQLINLPPNTFKSEFAHNVQMCQNPPQSSTESGSITHFSEAFEDTNVKITTSSPPDPSCHHHHHQFSENRFPLQTITSIQNISQSNTERRVVNSKDNHYTRLTAMDHQVNVMPRDNNFENTHIPFPQQYPENIGEKSSTLKPSTPGYRLSLNSVSNLSDISNSSFSDLISVMENDGEKVESTTIHFSPNSDVIFDF